MKSVAEKKPHALCVPFPAQGHITPMLKLAKILHSKGFDITFVNTEYNHRRLLHSRGPASLSGIPGFYFATIPDGLPPSDDNATQDVPSLCASTMINALPPFLDLLNRLNDEHSDSPPVTCIISDGVMSFALDAAKQLEVPCALFWTTSACGFMGYFHYRHLIERGLVPFKDQDNLVNGYLEARVDWIRGMKHMRLKDFPSFIRTTDPNDIMLNFAVHEAGRAALAAAIIINTFDDLEPDVVDAVSSLVPPLYTIGPLSLLAADTPGSPLASLGSNLWKEESCCMEWLQGRRPGSVVYVNYGSVTVMTNQQLIEFAWGLANSKHDFLWVMRPDLVRGDSAVLPQELLHEIKGRSLLANWCPQEEVLKHPAVGGFLTHCGWNSTLESICGGVPMICWPFFAEQQTNCRYSCAEWGVGMELDSNVKRGEVEGLIRELMGGEKGKEMRMKVLEWKKKAMRATGPGGSSSVNFDRLVSDVLLRSKCTWTHAQFQSCLQ